MVPLLYAPSGLGIWVLFVCSLCLFVALVFFLYIYTTVGPAKAQHGRPYPKLSTYHIRTTYDGVGILCPFEGVWELQ